MNVRKDKDQGSFFDGLKKIMAQLDTTKSDNLQMVCCLLEDKTAESKPSRMINPIKVLSWCKEMSLQMCLKQVEIKRQTNVDISDNNRYQDFVESLKVNKDIRDLSTYVDEHVLSVLDKNDKIYISIFDWWSFPSGDYEDPD